MFFLNVLGRIVIHVVAVTRRFRAGVCSDCLAGFGGEAMDLFGAEDAALLQDGLLLGGERRRNSHAAAFETFRLAGCKLLDFLADADAAPVVTAHGTEIG